MTWQNIPILGKLISFRNIFHDWNAGKNDQGSGKGSFGILILINWLKEVPTEGIVLNLDAKGKPINTNKWQMLSIKRSNHSFLITAYACCSEGETVRFLQFGFIWNVYCSKWLLKCRYRRPGIFLELFVRCPVRFLTDIHTVSWL